MGSGGGLWEGPATNPPYGDLLSHDRLNQKTLFIGSSDPATTFAGMLYYNTSTNTLEIRKADNDSWFIGLNQSLKSTDSPIFAGLTLTAFSGFVRATAGVISASALIASDIPSLAASKITSGTFGTSYLDLSALAQNIAFTSTQTVDGVDISALLIKTTKVTDLGTIWDKTTKIAYGDTNFTDQYLNQASSPAFANLHLGTGKLYFSAADAQYIFASTTTEIDVFRDLIIGYNALVGTPAASNSTFGILAASGSGVYYSGSLIVNGTTGAFTITAPSILTLNANGGVSFNGNITFTGTQTVDGRDISADIDQHLLTTSSPTFAGLSVTGGTSEHFSLVGEGTLNTDACWIGDSGKVLYLQMGSGNQIIFRNATANNRMILDSNGQLSLPTLGVNGGLIVGNGSMSYLHGTFGINICEGNYPAITLSYTAGNARDWTLYANSANDSLTWDLSANNHALGGTKMTLDASGNLGIGVTPVYPLDVIGAIVSRNYATQGILRTLRGDGTLASPTAIQNGDLISQIAALGYYDTTHMITGADILVYADGNFSSATVHPTYMVFRTSPAGSDIIEGMRLTSAGNLYLAGGLKVGGNILTEGNYIFTDATATNKRILISGGSASITDGAYFGLYGITYSGSEGRMELQAGNVNNAHAVIAFYTPDTTPNLQLRMTINQGALGNSGISIYEPVTITDTFMPQFKVAYDAARYLTFTHTNITGTYGAYANDLAITVASAGAGGGNILLTPLAGAIVIASTAIKAAGYQSSDGTAGETFSAVTCKTLTVKNGLVVAHTT